MFWVIALGLAFRTGIYTAIGGLRVIMYTAVLQTPVLLFGSICILLIGLSKLGGGHFFLTGWQAMMTTVGRNVHLVRPLSDKSFPWLAVLPGSAVIGFWYWCTDQYIVQRVLAGKNQQESRRGTSLQLTGTHPGVYLHDSGYDRFRADEDGRKRFRTSGDAAYTSLVAQILPHGIRGIVACGMLASLMASLASKFNASATLFTMDFYQKWHPTASGLTQVLVGRIATGVIVRVGILWIPVMKTLGKNLYEHLQSVQGYMSPAIAVLFVAGIFWKRANAPAAFWSFLVGAFGGFFRLGLDLLIGPPLKDGIVHRGHAPGESMVFCSTCSRSTGFTTPKGC